MFKVNEDYVPGNMKVIDLSKPKEVEYLMRELNLSELRLRLLVREVGPSIQDIKKCIGLDW